VLRRGRKRGSFPHWVVWPVVGILSVSLGGAVSPLFNRNRVSRTRIAAPPPPPGGPVLEDGSYLGVNGLRDTSEGVVFDYVTPPGSSADKAGLVGGDVINSLDGKPIRNIRMLREVLERTPPGKTVDVIFRRDGTSMTTKLTTLSEAETEVLEEQFEERPEGLGYIGEGTELERAQVPGTNIYGVRLDEIRTNNPADISGLRNGDIVIEFDGIPTRTRRELESRIQRALPGSTVKVIVMRGGERVEIPVKVGREE
jgi:S1-C subfamily serine protease